MGGMLGNKRQDRRKKFQGARNFGGGNFWGKCKKRVEKLFWGSVGGAVKCQKRGGKTFWWFQKVVGIFVGVTAIFWGRIFRVKKKIPGGILWKIKKKKFRGDFLGGSYTGGRVWGECWEIKDKIGEKNFRGPEILGGKLLGEMQEKGWKNFLGEVLGEL